jgi:hypothetical protein
MVGCPKKKAWLFYCGIRSWITWTEQSQIQIGHLLPLWEVQKVSLKIGVIESLLEKVNILLLGSGMIFTFYKAQGLKVGASLVEEDKLDHATSLIEKAKAKGVSLLLPIDVVIADKFAPNANIKVLCHLFPVW